MVLVEESGTWSGQPQLWKLVIPSAAYPSGSPSGTSRAINLTSLLTTQSLRKVLLNQDIEANEFYLALFFLTQEISSQCDLAASAED